MHVPKFTDSSRATHVSFPTPTGTEGSPLVKSTDPELFAFNFLMAFHWRGAKLI